MYLDSAIKIICNSPKMESKFWSLINIVINFQLRIWFIKASMVIKIQVEYYQKKYHFLFNCMYYGNKFLSGLQDFQDKLKNKD